MHEFKKINVVGLGYIGLPTAALIASRGLQVVGIDTNERIVETVASGKIHIAEPDLDGLVSKVVSSGALTLPPTCTNPPCMTLRFMAAVKSWRRLDWQASDRAACCALSIIGIRSAMRMATIPMTVINSIKVKAFRARHRM